MGGGCDTTPEERARWDAEMADRERERLAELSSGGSAATRSISSTEAALVCSRAIASCRARTWFDLMLFGPKPVDWEPWRKGWKPESAADRRAREAVRRDVTRHFRDVRHHRGQ